MLTSHIRTKCYEIIGPFVFVKQYLDLKKTQECEACVK